MAAFIFPRSEEGGIISLVPFPRFTRLTSSVKKASSQPRFRPTQTLRTGVYASEGWSPNSLRRRLPRRAPGPAVGREGWAELEAAYLPRPPPPHQPGNKKQGPPNCFGLSHVTKGGGLSPYTLFLFMLWLCDAELQPPQDPAAVHRCGSLPPDADQGRAVEGPQVPRPLPP